MERVREEPRASNNGGSSQNNMLQSLNEEVPYPPLNLPLTKSPELIKEFESLLQQQQQPHHYYDSTQKVKAFNFPITKITIGEWTREAVYEQDLKAKIYFAKKKILWECLEDVTTETTRLSKKIEIEWCDVLSLKPSYNPHDCTGILKVELRKPPRFFKESNPQSGKHSQWLRMDQDFTANLSASRYRIHTLHFAPGVLQKNMQKLPAGDRFWLELLKVSFPTSEDLYFPIDYGSNQNNISYGETLCFNGENNLQGLGVGPPRQEEAKFNMAATQFRFNHMSQIQTNSYVQGDMQNQLPVMQAIQPSSQLIIEPYNRGEDFVPGFEFFNSNYREMSNTGELLGSQAHANTFLGSQAHANTFLGSQAHANTLLETQAYAYTLLGRQANSMMFQQTDGSSVYSHQVGSCEGYLGLEHTHLNGNFQIHHNHNQLFGRGYDYFQNMSSDNNGFMLPDIDNGDDDFNGQGL